MSLENRWWVYECNRPFVKLRCRYVESRLSSDNPEHIISHAALHRVGFPVFVFDARRSSLARHLFHALAQLGVGFGDGFGFFRSGWFTVLGI